MDRRPLLYCIAVKCLLNSEKDLPAGHITSTPAAWGNGGNWRWPTGWRNWNK